MYSVIFTAKMNGIDPKVRLANVLARMAAHSVHRLDHINFRHLTG